MFRAAFRQFLDKEIVPARRRVGAGRHRRPRRCSARPARPGFLGMAVPEEYGGGGVDDFRYNLVIAEEIQRAGRRRRRASASTLHNDICLPYFLDATHRRAEGALAAGHLLGRAHHRHRHDRARHRLRPRLDDAPRAIRDGDHYVVNGSKTFITNGINADLVITAVKTDPTPAPPGHVACSCSSAAWTGFERGRNLEKIGLHAQDTAELFFTDVHVPVENLLGEEGKGFLLPRAQPAPGAAVDRRSPASPPPGPRSTGRSSTCKERTGVRPADRLVPEQPRSRWPRWPPRSRSRQAFVDRCVAGPQRRRADRRGGRRWPSGGAPSCRAASSTAACSCTAATATCSSTRSPAPTPTPASPRIYGGTTEIMKEIIGKSLGV